MDLSRIDVGTTDSSSSDEMNIEAVPSKVWDEEISIQSGRPSNNCSSSQSKSPSVRCIMSSRYKGLKLSQLLCAVYVVVVTILYYPSGYFDPTAFFNLWAQTTEVTDKIAIICLFGARIAAFLMYPPIFLVFMTKCKATINFLMTTPFSFFMVHDQHELHSCCGKFLAIDVWVHTFFHCLRWGLLGTIDKLWTTRVSISGLVALLACVFVCIPMMVQRLMRSMSYEVRKFLHITFFYVFAVAMCFHNKTSAWPNGGYNQVILGFCITYYTLDAAYVTFFMTEMIETTIFNVLPSGVQMTMVVSENFQKTYAQGGYGYVCLPWVSKNQWHAFSLFEHPSNPNLRQVFMFRVGNWTSEVYEQLQRNTIRPAWIQGPFVSPYNNALAFDNTICVATGIGITPALSVIRAHRESRRINLIWACRDVAMLEFFMDHLWLNNDGWILIFYTGKEELTSAITFNGNVKLIKSRPNLDMVIPNIIYGIETGQGVPDPMPSEKAQVRERIARKVLELEEKGLSEDEIITELTFLAHERGFLLSNLVNEAGGKYRNKSLLQVIKEQFSSYQVCGPPGTQTSSSTNSYFRGGRQTRRRRRHDNTPSSPRANMHRFQQRNLSRPGLNSNNTTKYCPWMEQPAAEAFVLGLDKKSVLNTWGVMYCGGSKSVENRLRQTASKFDIKLLTESFAW